MEATSVSSSSAVVPDIKSVGRITLTWAKKHLPLAIIGGLLWGGICWAINVFLIIVYYDGWRKVPPGGMATAQTNLLWGGLVWALVSSVLFSFLGYLRSRRTETEVEDKQKYSVAYQEAKRADPKQFKSHFLVAVALGAVLFRFFDTLVLVFVASLFAARFSYIGFLATTMFFRVWLLIAPMFPRSYQRVVNRTFSPILWLSGTASGLLMGCIVTYIGGFFLSPEIVMLLILFYCLTQADRGPTNLPGSPAGTVAALLIMAGTFAAMRAFADDGGWRESGGNIQGLLQNEGFKPSFLWAVPGGLAGWVGFATGMALSDAITGQKLDPLTWIRAELERLVSQMLQQMTSSGLIDKHTGNLIAQKSAEVAKDYRDRGVTYYMGDDAEADGDTADCSHFVHDVLNQSGIDIPYVTTSDIGNDSHFNRIPASEARAGDIIVQGHHMGVYTGENDPDTDCPLGYQMGDHGAAKGKWGDGGWFAHPEDMRFYRPHE